VHPRTPAKESTQSSATKKCSPWGARTSTYAISGPTLMARLAGIVHGVVVQITADTCGARRAVAAAAPTAAAAGH